MLPINYHFTEYTEDQGGIMIMAFVSNEDLPCVSCMCCRLGGLGGGGDYTVPASAKNMRYIITRRRFTNTEILDLCSNVSSFQLKTRVCPFVSSNARSLRPLMWNIDHRKHEKTLKEWRENISSDHNTFQRNHRNSITVTLYLIRTGSPGTAKMYNTACPSIIFSWKVPGKYQYGQSD